MSPSERDFCRTWPAQSEVTARGHHVPQEDSPDEIGQALATWLQNLESSSNREYQRTARSQRSAVLVD